jgi:hypothetical protein
MGLASQPVGPLKLISCKFNIIINIKNIIICIMNIIIMNIAIIIINKFEKNIINIKKQPWFDLKDKIKNYMNLGQTCLILLLQILLLSLLFILLINLKKILLL